MQPRDSTRDISASISTLFINQSQRARRIRDSEDIIGENKKKLKLDDKGLD